MPPSAVDRPERLSVPTRTFTGANDEAALHRFEFPDYIFRGPRSSARAFQIRDHSLEILPCGKGRIAVRASLSWASWNFQSFPAPDFYPPRIGYRLICGDGSEIELPLMLVFEFSAYASGQSEGEAEIFLPTDIMIQRARWTILPYPERTQAYRLKRMTQ